MRVIIILLFLPVLNAVPDQQDNTLAACPDRTVPSQQNNAILIIQVENVRTTEGVLRLGFYIPSDNFPDEPHRNLVFKKTHMQDDVVRDTIRDLTPGTYALSLLDDTNSNGKMDYTVLGMPKEGFGFSNDARPKFLKSPDFKSCSFSVDQGTNLVSFRVKYF